MEVLSAIFTWINQVIFHSKFLWLLNVFLVVFGTFLLTYLEMRVHKRITEKLAKTDSIWDDAFFDAIHWPIVVFIWIWGFTFAVQVAGVEFKALSKWLWPVHRVGGVVLFSWFLIRFINRIEENFTFRDAKDKNVPVDHGTFHAVGNLIKISVIITSALVIMELLHVNIAPILALGGAGSIILGFASRDVLANFFGAVMIYMDRPFVVGDWIKVVNQQIEGTVESIGWRLTKIRNFDKRPVYVPNSLFATAAIENGARMTNRRIKELIGVRYKDTHQVQNITEQVQELLENHPQVDHRNTRFLALNQFGPSSVDLMLYAFTKVTLYADFVKVKQQLLLEVYKIIENNGAEIAFPTSTIEIPDGVKLNQASFKEQAS